MEEASIRTANPQSPDLYNEGIPLSGRMPSSTEFKDGGKLPTRPELYGMGYFHFEQEPSFGREAGRFSVFKSNGARLGRCCPILLHPPPFDLTAMLYIVAIHGGKMQSLL